MGLVCFDELANVLTLYTANKVKAAHILYDKKLGQRALCGPSLSTADAPMPVRARKAWRTLPKSGTKLAKLLGVEREEVLFASTGVIGRRLPVEDYQEGPAGISKKSSAKAVQKTSPRQS